MSTVDPRILPALVWDVPTLRDSGNGGFADVFDPSRFVQEDVTDEFLKLAAHGLRECLFGDERVGRETFAQLEDSAIPGARIFALALQAWPYSRPTGEYLEQFLRETARVDDRQLRARLQLKALNFAVDGKQLDVISDITNAILESVIPGSWLHRVAAESCRVVMGGHWPSLVKPVGERDPLVDLDWIDWKAFDSARNVLDRLVEERARSAWSETFSFGAAGPLDRIIAAELAATWAGAPWMRRDLQRQITREVILREQLTDDWPRYAAEKWVASKERFSKIAPIIEPHLNPGDADAILDAVAPVVSVDALSGHVLFDAYQELWDLISDSACERFVETSTPLLGDHPNLLNMRAAWAAMGVRVPDAWSRRFTELPRDEKLSILGVITGWTAQNLPKVAAEPLWELVTGMTVEDLNALGGDWTGPVGGLAVSLQHPYPEHLLKSLGPNAVVGVAEDYPSLVPKSALMTAVESLTSTLRRDIKQAKSGTIHGYSRDPRWALARGLIALKEPIPAAVEALIDTTTGVDVPVDYRISALSGLRALAFHGVIPDITQDLEDAPLGGRAAFSAANRPARVGVHLAAIRAWFASSDEWATEISGLARDDDAQVRATAVESAGFLSKRHESEFAASIVVGALFDPSRDVVRSAVRALPSLPAEFTARQHSVLAGKLANGMAMWPRSLRSLTVISARALLRRGHEEYGAIVDLGHQDQSWIVRAEAARSELETASDGEL